MNFLWNEQTIGWFLDAGAYTGFHKKLAQMIIPHLEAGDTLCDLGCGIGRLDLELAPHVSRLTAVDINESVTELLRRDADNMGIRNLDSVCGDAGSFDGSFDVLLMSFFGLMNMADMRKLCRRKFIRVVHKKVKEQLHPGDARNARKETVQTVREELEKIGADYTLETATIEFGQPLRSWLDAERFVRQNAPNSADGEIDGFLRENLTRTGRDDFPFYLPNPKGIGVFMINMGDSK